MDTFAFTVQDSAEGDNHIWGGGVGGGGGNPLGFSVLLMLAKSFHFPCIIIAFIVCLCS